MHMQCPAVGVAWITASEHGARDGCYISWQHVDDVRLHT